MSVFKRNEQRALPTSIDLYQVTARPLYQNWSGEIVNELNAFTTSSIVSAIIGSINGYVLSKWRFRGSKIVFMSFLFGMFIPYQAIMIPLVQFNKWAHLTGSIYTLVVAHIIYGIPICT